MHLQATFLLDIDFVFTPSTEGISTEIEPAGAAAGSSGHEAAGAGEGGSSVPAPDCQPDSRPQVSCQLQCEESSAGA